MDGFERQVKIAELQIKLIETLGKWNKDMAEAEKTWAEAQSIEIKNEVLKRIKKQLDFAIFNLNKHAKLQQDRMDRLASDNKRIANFRTGTKPGDAGQLSSIHEALLRLISEMDAGPIGEFYGAPLEDAHRAQNNYVAVSASSQLSPVPADIDNFGLLLDWTKAKRLFFVKARPAHLFVLKTFAELGKAYEARQKELEDKLAATKQSDYADISALRVFLNLPASVEKSPAKPADGA